MDNIKKLGKIEVEYYFDFQGANFGIYRLVNNKKTLPIIVYTYSTGYLSLYDEVQTEFEEGTQIDKFYFISELEEEFNIKINKTNND